MFSLGMHVGYRFIAENNVIEIIEYYYSHYKVKLPFTLWSFPLVEQVKKNKLSGAQNM